jgi:hypothetical protein
MIPVSALADLYNRPDAGYCSYYWFTKEAADEIRARKHSGGLAVFSVYTKYLVVDIDRENDLHAALRDMEQYSLELQAENIKHSVWVSGGKGFHIYIHCEPMEGTHVPYSQLKWIESRNWKVDKSLYQHGRLLSNPGRKSKKTGVRKHKIREFDGNLLRVPTVQPPVRAPAPAGEITSSDKLRLAFFRLQKILEVEPDSRHTTIWSTAGMCADAGIEEELTIQLLTLVNKQWQNPKDHDGLVRAVNQAYTQTSRKVSE